jgi:hypothetical protein
MKCLIPKYVATVPQAMAEAYMGMEQDVSMVRLYREIPQEVQGVVYVPLTQLQTV